jgi:undecaprenyl-diphosphatase
MLAATGLDIIKNGAGFSEGQIGLLAAGFLVAFCVAMASIKFLLYFIKNHNFIIFGIYRILVALLLLILWIK